MSEQKTLISLYMGSIDSDDTELKMFVNEELERLKEVIKENIGIQEIQSDKQMKENIGKVYGLLEGFRTKRELVKEDLVFILKAQELAKEIQE